MNRESRKISRRDLYQQVWETSINKLSREYGLSDVGFAKICKKHNIPRPPRGYWAKLAAGKSPGKIPLPDPDSDAMIEFGVHSSKQLSGDEQSSGMDGVGLDIPEIAVAKSLRNPHPLIKQISESVDMADPDSKGLIAVPGGKDSGFQVSRDRSLRALRSCVILFSWSYTAFRT